MEYKDTYQIKNCFDETQLQWLMTKLNDLQNDPNAKRDRAKKEGRKNELWIPPHHEDTSKEIRNLIAPLLPFAEDEYEFFSLNFYKLQIPYALHCDNLGDEKGFYQAVIPLKIKPARATYTILFDQTSDINTEWVAPIYNMPKNYKPFHNKPITDPTYYPGWSNEYKITDDIGEKYWGKTWKETFKEAYKGFSIKEAYQWSVGDLYVFNSKYNHCASELNELGFEYKIGLLACLQKK